MLKFSDTRILKRVIGLTFHLFLDVEDCKLTGTNLYSDGHPEEKKKKKKALYRSCKICPSEINPSVRSVNSASTKGNGEIAHSCT